MLPKIKVELWKLPESQRAEGSFLSGSCAGQRERGRARGRTCGAQVRRRGSPARPPPPPPLRNLGEREPVTKGTQREPPRPRPRKRQTMGGSAAVNQRPPPRQVRPPRPLRPRGAAPEPPTRPRGAPAPPPPAWPRRVPLSRSNRRPHSSPQPGPPEPLRAGPPSSPRPGPAGRWKSTRGWLARGGAPGPPPLPPPLPVGSGPAKGSGRHTRPPPTPPARPGRARGPPTGIAPQLPARVLDPGAPATREGPGSTARGPSAAPGGTHPSIAHGEDPSGAEWRRRNSGTSETAPCYRLTKWRRRPARLARAGAPLAGGAVTLTGGRDLPPPGVGAPAARAKSIGRARRKGRGDSPMRGAIR